jgi:hypothetical protein
MPRPLVPPPAFLSLVALYSSFEGPDEVCGKRSVHCCLVRVSTRSAVTEILLINTSPPNGLKQ